MKVQLVEYDPWGKVSRTEGNADPTHRFTGKELDPETGLMYYGGRYYDPVLGRFISPDPFVPSPGNPQSLNRYSYVENNPPNRIDPSGHFSLGKFFKKLFGGIAKALPAIITAVVVAAVVIATWGTATPVLIAAGALAGAAAGAVNTALYGGNFATNILLGAAFGGIAGGIGPPLAGALGGGFGGVVGAAAILAGTFGGVSAAIQGGDIGMGILYGAASGAIVSAAMYGGYKLYQLANSSALAEAGGPPSSPGKAGNLKSLPPGEGYYRYSAQTNQYGNPATLEVIQQAGEIWGSMYADQPFGIGDISLEGGGPFPPHKGHTLGLEFDVRPLRVDGYPGRTNINNPTYSSALTQNLVNVLLNDPKVVRIYFNDPNVKGVTPYPGHSDHLHVVTRP